MVHHTMTTEASQQEKPRKSNLGFFLLAVLALAGSATAEQLYVPLGIDPASTEIRIDNGSRDPSMIATELLDPFGSVGRTGQIELGPGETIRSDHDRGGGLVALSITSTSRVSVTAVRHLISSGSFSSVPVLDVQDAAGEGMVRIGTAPADGLWTRGITVINPHEAGALLIISLHQGEQVIEEGSLHVPGRGAKVVSIDDLFGRKSEESGDWLSFRSSRSVLLAGYQANQRTGAQFWRPAVPLQTIPSRRRRAATRQTAPVPTPQTVVLTPSRDNTLFQTTNGSLSNGAGIHLFSGATNTRQLRRALLAFDLASQIPSGSRITSVSLALEISQTISGAENMELRRVSADWGEGASNAGSSNDGDGAASRTGDATWIHTFFPDRMWSRQGGDFDSAADARASAGSGTVTWASEGMIARVQVWLDQPSTNFGWILLGNEATARTAKRFNSREIPTSSSRPLLTIEFEH